MWVPDEPTVRYHSPSRRVGGQREPSPDYLLAFIAGARLRQTPKGVTLGLAGIALPQYRLPFCHARHDYHGACATWPPKAGDTEACLVGPP
jgi:hypothetical protein